MGYEYHLDSALVRDTQERWLKLQDFIPCLNGLHMRPFQFHLKEHWRYQSLDNLLPWTDAISAHLDQWQNPANVIKGSDLHPKDHSIQHFTDASNEGWGAHLDHWPFEISRTSARAKQF